MENKRRSTINLLAFLGVLILIFVAIGNAAMKPPQKKVRIADSTHKKTLWKYQCIDTMKTSRDKARAWKNRPDLDEHIDREVAAIRDMGGNCVAISTPYDEEFLPYLTKWVKAARKYNLHVWFRGNFSSWEGWFEYPKGMTNQQLFSKTEKFVTSNPDLFEDGDIFTAAPEGENGGPFNQVEIDEHEAFRKFLIEENEISKKAFDQIGKDVTVNWFSMNGGLAKRMMNQETVDAIGKTVTIDHYIKTAPEMGEFIQYFVKNFGARVVIGEFGAPIPEINGAMTNQQQAEFTEELFQELYKNKDHVDGISYWILYDGSTALLDQNLKPKPAVDVVKKYFKPRLLSGEIINDLGEPLAGVTVASTDGVSKTVTNSSGEYELLIPNDSVNLQVIHSDYKAYTATINLKKSENQKNIVLRPTNESVPHKFQLIFNKWFN